MLGKRLTEEVRKILREPIGLLLTEKDGIIPGRLKRILEESRSRKVIVVGDYTARRLQKHGLDADVYILDNKIMRQPTRPLDLDLDRTIYVRNPAGNITEEAWRGVEEAVRSDKRTKVMVCGEEDLLALPAILSSPVGSLVLYGQPRAGLVVVSVTKEKKSEVSRIVERMEED